MTEAPIDALSLAALEGVRADTFSAATGGMGPGTEQTLAHALALMTSLQDALLANATDTNAAGGRYTARHAELADAAGVAFERLTPTVRSDWNCVLRKGRGL